MKPRTDIEALQSLDRALTPSEDADKRIRVMIETAIESETTTDPAEICEPLEITVLDADGTWDSTLPTQANKRWQRPQLLLGAAAVLVVVLGLVAVMSNRGSDDPTLVVASNPDTSALTPVQQICNGVYRDVADEWRLIVESAEPGFVATPTREAADSLVRRQEMFVEAIQREINTGGLEIDDTTPFEAAVASIAETRATLSMEGGANVVTTIGNTHRHLTQLIEDNPALATHCDAALLAWPQ